MKKPCIIVTMGCKYWSEGIPQFEGLSQSHCVPCSYPSVHMAILEEQHRGAKDVFCVKVGSTLLLPSVT